MESTETKPVAISANLNPLDTYNFRQMIIDSPDQFAVGFEIAKDAKVEELADGAVVVELPYAGTSWLVREILRGAGDLVVLDPPEAREAISRELAA